MGVTIRSASADDASECGRICHDAFASIATRHGFPPDFPSVEVATGLVSGLIAHPGFFGIVAEHDGRIVGSNFLDERSMIAGVGPITVDADVQDRQIGRALMNAVLQRGADRKVPGVRLLQVAYHNRSMSLYAKLGFDIREPFAAMQGDPLALQIPGYGSGRRTRPIWKRATRCVCVCTATTAVASCVMRSRRGPPGWSNAAGGSPGTRPGSPFSRTRWPRPTTICRP